MTRENAIAILATLALGGCSKPAPPPSPTPTPTPPSIADVEALPNFSWRLDAYQANQSAMAKIRGKFVVLDLDGRNFAPAQSSLPEHKRPLTKEECQKVKWVVFLRARPDTRKRAFMVQGGRDAGLWQAYNGELYVVDLEHKTIGPARGVSAEASKQNLYWNNRVNEAVNSIYWDLAPAATPTP